MKPFRIHVADEVLEDLRARLRRTRWPDQISGIGWEQGTELDWLRRLVSYWANEFDWRAWERKLNALNQFTWDGIHFVHQRAASGAGVPLILTHGWPSSFLDYLEMLPMLEDFDVVVPSLPGYGFSPRPPEVGINYRYVAQRWHRLMTELGYSRYGAGGNDFGSGVSTFLAIDHPESLIGVHLTTLESDLTPKVDDAELSDIERSYLAVSRGWDKTERGYSAIQSTKPQTVGYGLNDSPAGLAAYLGEKWHSWSDVTPPDDFLCATLTLYWVTQTITSSMRDYWDNHRYPVGPAYVGTPTAFTVFAHQTLPEGEPPRSYLERVYNIRRWTVFPRGGHFAPVEEPGAIAGDLTAFFRDLSSGDRNTAPCTVGEENRKGAVGTTIPAASERVMLKGEVAEPGFGHFGKCRPKFYQTVLALSGVALYQGTINVKIDGEMPRFPLPSTQRIPGQDQIDLDHHQDILITPCVMEGRPGFWILPVFKGTWNPNPAGHFPKHIIEISLVEELPNLTPGLTVSLEIPGTR